MLCLNRKRKVSPDWCDVQNCIKLTTILSFIILAGVLDAVEPVGALHQHHQPLQALGVDGVQLHGVLLQGVFVSEPLLTQRADHIGTFV